MATPRKIAVLGGGLAGLTAAYELAERCPDCTITVYQMGWRLGGKVASSRNGDRCMRIEEHGIHVLFGAYENAFHLLRRVYDELGLRWQDAFAERNDFTVMEALGKRWEAWHLSMARNPGDPGDCLFRGERGNMHAMDMTAEVLVWLRERVLEYFTGTPFAWPARWFFGATLGRAQHTAERARDKDADPAADASADEQRLLWHLRGNLFLLRIVGWIGYIVWTVLRPFLGSALRRVDGLRRLWIAAELGTAAAAGLTRAALDGRPLEDLDEHDLTEWLEHNGVLGAGITKTSARSAPLRMVYEVVFAYEGGDPARPRLAAGTGLRDLLRLLFDRRGALAYTMRAGSAETMITPLYRALRQRNVHFEFFRRIDRLEVSADGRRVDRVCFTRQAEPTHADYDPLVGDGAWPDRPKHALLRDGERLMEGARRHGGHAFESPDFTPPDARRDTLERGEHFDAVVLAIPIDALRTICAPLAERSRRWRDMFAHLKTTATQSVQLWFDRTAADLGWNTGGSDEPALLGGYAQPFGNWVDLSVTLQNEDWPRDGRSAPNSVAYLCGPLADSTIADGGHDTQAIEVRKACQSWLGAFARDLWPNAFGRDGFDFGCLISTTDASGAGRYEEQFFRANTNPADRYTLTLPGTTRYRLAPDESGFEGLYLAGDWTENSFDVGAVEATVMSGRLAARAILGLDDERMPIYGASRRPAEALEPQEPAPAPPRRDDFIRPTVRRPARRKPAPTRRAA